MILKHLIGIFRETDMMLIGFGVKILFLIHKRKCYVNFMYKELGDFLEDQEMGSCSYKVSDPCDPLVILSFTDPY